MITEVLYQGVTTTPSDYNSKDGELAYTDKLIVKDGNLVVPKQPDTVIDSFGANLSPLFRHNTSSEDTNWILWDSGVNKGIKYKTEDGIKTILNIDDKPVKIEAMGNTLIILLGDGTPTYATWKESEYKYLGSTIPELGLHFQLQGEFVRSDLQYGVLNVVQESAKDDGWEIKDDRNVALMTNTIFGYIEEFFRKEGYEKGRFSSPFLIRYALRLYDGSYTCPSNIILMIPSGGHSPYVYSHSSNSTGADGSAFRQVYIKNVFADLYVKKLFDESITDWKDVVKGVGIFVSRQFDNYDRLGKINKVGAKIRGFSSDEGMQDATSFARVHYTFGGIERNFENFLHSFSDVDNADEVNDHNQAILPWTTDDTIIRTDNVISNKSQADEIANCSTFYLLKEYNFLPDENKWEFENVADKDKIGEYCKVDVSSVILRNIETQLALSDDYFSRDKKSAKSSYLYNAKLSLANINRIPFGGFKPTIQTPYTTDSSEGQSYPYITVKYHVFIDEGGVMIHTETASTYVFFDGSGYHGNYTYSILPPFFYYPNPNATDLVVEYTLGEKTTYQKFHLKKHPTLNGSYLLSRTPLKKDRTENSIDVDTFNAMKNRYTGVSIPHPNQVYTSLPYNPYIFNAEDVNEIEWGSEIKTLASTTKALSQGQFGQFPLYLFASSGIWAMELNSKGQFGSVSPVTRDIICGNGESLTQLDDSIVFATDRGIMELSGKNTRLISGALDKKAELPELAGVSLSVPDVSFKEYVKDSRIVFDYVNQRLIVFNGEYDYYYIYDIANKLWTNSKADSNLTSTINAYPEAYAVNSNGAIVNLSTIGEIGNEEISNGWIITRPISLGDSNQYKIIDYVRQNGVFSHQRNKAIEQILYGSNDLVNWFVISSADSFRISGYSGTPFKWFRLAVHLQLKQGESISSVTFSWRSKFTNDKLF